MLERYESPDVINFEKVTSDFLNVRPLKLSSQSLSKCGYLRWSTVTFRVSIMWWLIYYHKDFDIGV
jgi:hypothetical protein